MTSARHLPAPSPHNPARQPPSASLKKETLDHYDPEFSGENQGETIAIKAAPATSHLPNGSFCNTTGCSARSTPLINGICIYENSENMPETTDTSCKLQNALEAVMQVKKSQRLPVKNMQQPAIPLV